MQSGLILGALLGAFGLMALIFLAIGISPLEAFYQMYLGAFGDRYAFSEVLVKATPLMFTGLAVALALKMRLWNIGAEGQLYLGAFGATWAAQTFGAGGLPPLLLLPAMILSAMLCGALWGGIVGFLRERLGVNEILTSLMLNYVGISWVNYFIYGPWRDPRSPGFPITKMYVPEAWLSQFMDTRLHSGLILALLAGFALWVLIEKSRWGFEIRATGESWGAAQYAGIPVQRNIVLVFLLSGALAALAGMSEVAGLHHKLQPGNVSANYGYTGIIVAWLANAHPLGVLLVAFLTGIIFVGADSLKITLGVSSDVVQIILGLIIICLLIGNFFRTHRISIRRAGEQE